MIICKTPTLEVFCICYLHDVNNILQCMCLVSYLRINMCHQLPQNVAKAHQPRRHDSDFMLREASLIPTVPLLLVVVVADKI